MFKTHYNAKDFPKSYEKLSDRIMVEQAGYISAKQRIENLLFAGQRLVQSRAEMYDFTGEVPHDEDFQDPTRSKNFDLADATAIQLHLTEKQRTKKTEKALKDSQPSEPTPPVIDEVSKNASTTK